MKRHPSLQPLSREHHGALILARLLQKNAPVYTGLPSDWAGKAAYAIQFYKDELISHFNKEEEALKLLQGINTELDLMIKNIFQEHQLLHGLFKEIENDSSNIDRLDETGKILELHIRKEERELFPLIQEVCGEEHMEAVGMYLSSH